LVIDGPFEVNFEEIREAMIDHQEDEWSEIVDEIRVPLDSHVEEVEANILFGENLVDDVL
jgi:hypothetical protein